MLLQLFHSPTERQMDVKLEDIHGLDHVSDNASRHPQYAFFIKLSIHYAIFIQSKCLIFVHKHFEVVLGVWFIISQNLLDIAHYGVSVLAFANDFLVETSFLQIEGTEHAGFHN